MQLGLIPPNSLWRMMQQTDLHLIVPDQLHDPSIKPLEELTGYMILDNGAAEEAIKPLNWLDRMASTGFFNEVVALDRLRDCAASMAGAQVMKDFREKRHVSIMAVAQGQTLAEVMKCIYAYTLWDHIDVIGLPRVLNEQFGDRSRVALVESLSNDKGLRDKPIHCLGAHYAFPEEIRYLSQFPLVRSMDSSLPFVLGLYGLRFTDAFDLRGVRRQTGYFQMMPDEFQQEVIEDNVRTYINWSATSGGAL